jgi:predicted transcriptional regulator YdeE
MSAREVHGEIIEVKAMLLAGISFYGNPFAASSGWTEENEIGRLWARFMAMRGGDDGELPPPLVPELMYELHITDTGTAETGNYEVFIGYEIADASTIPLSLLVKSLPRATFARFTLSGEAIRDEDHYLAMAEWITGHGYAPQNRWMYQTYDRRYRGLDRLAESEIDVYLPLE